MRILFVLLLVLGGLAWPARASTPERVQVRLLERRGLHAIHVLASQPVRLEAVRHQLRVDGRPVQHAEFGSEGFGLRLEGGVRRYKGRLLARAEAGRLVLVNEVPLEEYVAGVVGAELAGHWPAEALKAQAVLARTLAFRGGAHPGGTLCDLTHCQAYQGIPSAPATRASAATRGLVLTYHGAVIRPLYHSTCGGTLASNQVVFGGSAVAYLQAGPDPFCAASPHAATWSLRVRPDEVARALSRPRVERLEVPDRSTGGWVRTVRVDGEPMSGYRFWQALGREIGWGALKSLNFDARREGPAFVFTGRGLGHGVGMCQWGARGRADAGWDFRRILLAYYPAAGMRRG